MTHTIHRRLGVWSCVTAATVATIAAATGPVPTVTNSARALDPVIRQGFGVSAYTLQVFTPPPGAELGFDAAFTLAGAVRTIRFVPVEMNAAGCVMSLDTGAAELTDVPAPDAGIYEGEITGGGTAIAQMLNGKLSALVRIGAQSWNIQPVSDLIAGADPRVHIVVAGDAILPGGGTCAEPGHEHGAAPVLVTPTPTASVGGSVMDGSQILVCEVACESDYEFSLIHNLNASAAAQDIAKVMAWAGKYFTEGANVKFKITRYVIRLNPLTNPYTTSEPGALLDQFAAHWNLKFTQTQRDLAHLFTGRELEGTVIGIARISSVCSETMGYALSQSLYTSLLGKRAALTAHEVGHNFSAQHCDQAQGLCAPCRIMLAGTGIGIQNLSFGCSGPFIAFYAEQRPCLEPLETNGGGLCRPDMTFDGQLSLGDFGAFQTAYALGITVLADFSGDGQLTLADFGAFQSAYAAGCP